MIEPVRVLHIVHTLDRGGMESRIMDLYRHLDHDKFQYDFYVESGQSGIFDDEVRKLGGMIYKSKGHSWHNLPDFKAFRIFLMKHPEYKIVYAYNQWAGFYLREAKNCGVRYRVANARTSIETRSFKNIMKNLMKQNVNLYATHRFAVSKKAAYWLFGEKKVKNGLVEVWPNAIDTEKYRFSDNVRKEVRYELNLGDSFTVIHVGNIRFEKNHPFLLRIFAEIKKTKKNAKLILIGGGEIETLKPLINELKINKDVICLGVRQDVPRLLQAGDIFIFPSLYEGFPGAVLEAEASGLNCIVSDSITDEVMLTDHIKMISIKKGPKSWSKLVNSFKSVKRETECDQIKRAGYDIEDLVTKTEKLLMNMKH